MPKAEFSQEGADIKRRFLKIFNEWENEFYDGSKIRKTDKNKTGSGITKGRAHRGLYSLLMSPDDVHLDYIDNRLSKNATVKSMMGGLGGRVQKLTDGGLSPYAVSPTDSLHHRNNHSSYGSTARIQDPNILRKWLQISADNDEIYGEGEGNLAGNSQDSRSHTGARGKPGKRFNPTVAGHGPDGKTELSSHPRGTTDADVAIPRRVYSSGEEMFEAGSDVRQRHKQDLAIGKAADQSRRASINSSLKKGGIILPGEDAFSADAPQATRTAAKNWLSKNRQAMIDAAEAFDPELARKVAQEFEGGSMLALDPLTPAIKQAYKLFKSNKTGALLGAIQDPQVVDRLDQGDVKGAAVTTGKNALTGALIQQGLTSAAKALPSLAPIIKAAGPLVAGAGFFAEGRTDGFVDKAVNVLDRRVNANLPTRNDPETDIGKRSGDWIKRQWDEAGKQKGPVTTTQPATPEQRAKLTAELKAKPQPKPQPREKSTIEHLQNEGKYWGNQILKIFGN